MVDDVKMGSLCILDMKARQLTNEEHLNFLDIGAAVNNLIKERNQRKEKMIITCKQSVITMVDMIATFKQDLVSVHENARTLLSLAEANAEEEKLKKIEFDKAKEKEREEMRKELDKYEENEENEENKRNSESITYSGSKKYGQHEEEKDERDYYSKSKKSISKKSMSKREKEEMDVERATQKWVHEVEREVESVEERQLKENARLSAQALLLEKEQEEDEERCRVEELRVVSEQRERERKEYERVLSMQRLLDLEVSVSSLRVTLEMSMCLGKTYYLSRPNTYPNPYPNPLTYP